jgi:hypothetical protein
MTWSFSIIKGQQEMLQGHEHEHEHEHGQVEMEVHYHGQ